LAAALVRGGLELRESPFPAVLSDPAFARVRARIAVSGHRELDRDQPDGRGAIGAITTVDGAKVVRRVDHPKGHRARGAVAWSELDGKWREGLPECDVDKIVSTAERLDDVEDFSEFLDVLNSDGRGTPHA